MSMRNHYSKTYSKVAPFPPSNKLVQDGRISSKQSIVHRQRSDKKTMANHSDMYKVKETRNYQFSNFVNDTVKPVYPIAGVNMKSHPSSKENFGISSNKLRYEREINHNAVAYLGNKEQRKPSEFGNKNALSENKQTTDSDVNVFDQGLTNANECVLKSNNRNKSETDWQYTTGENSINAEQSRALRPKSARPESRWERRQEEVIDDSVVQIKSKPPRPKSARPESRLMRMLDTAEDEEINKETDRPARPQTSHGRHNSDNEIINKDEFIRYERPKSRLGHRERTILYLNNDDDEGMVMDQHIEVAKSRKSRNKSKNKYRIENEDNSEEKLVRENAALRTHRHEAVLSTEDFPQFHTDNAIIGLNYGIDDIDLDIDPVQFFMQDDNFTPRGIIKNPSLSKDTIEFIGNTKLTPQRKAAVGYHGNNQNKYNAFTENSTRYHRNGFSNHFNPSSVEKEQISTNDRHARLKADKQSRSKYVTSAIRDDYYTSHTANNSISETRLTRLCGYRNNHDDKIQTVDTHDVKSESMTNGNKSVVKRKPRKLEPLSASLYNHR